MSGNLKEFKENVTSDLGDLTAVQLNALYGEVLKEYAGRLCGEAKRQEGVEVRLSAEVVVGAVCSVVMSTEHLITHTASPVQLFHKGGDDPLYVDTREPYGGC